jgi:hypothetical protein
MDINVGKQAIAEASKKLSNWAAGERRSDRHLNHRHAAGFVAASLIRTGKVFAPRHPLDSNGPQTGLFGGRFNPIHRCWRPDDAIAAAVTE